MADQATHAVTGAFGYSGKYIAARLLNSGQRVITLTNADPKRNPFDDRVRSYPLAFDDPESLTQALSGVEVLYNTYWVRFNHRTFTHAQAVENTRRLFTAAKRAGVRRVVHLSITNPSEASHLTYFRGKAQLERALMESGLSYAILRPTVLFGGEDILINNIAWALRRFPVFAVFGNGSYRLQPVFVEDLASLAVEGGRSGENLVINAIGPETFTYRALVKRIGELIGNPRPVVSVPPVVGHWIGAVIGYWKGDVMITREEIEGLMAELLHVDTPPTGKTRLTEWAREHAASLGVHYRSELARRRR